MRSACMHGVHHAACMHGLSLNFTWVETAPVIAVDTALSEGENQTLESCEGAVHRSALDKEAIV